MLPAVASPSLGPLDREEKSAPAQKCLPAAQSTTARHCASSAISSSTSARWLSSGSSKKLAGGLFSSACTTWPDRVTRMSCVMSPLHHTRPAGEYRVQPIGSGGGHHATEEPGIVACGQILPPPRPQPPGQPLQRVLAGH